MTSTSPRCPTRRRRRPPTVAAVLWSLLGQAGFTRTDAVVGVGGGTVTDLAGFVAASWLRGVRVVQVPTTLLGMVDAAVGGKTGINTAEGKNLVGAFHPPAGVLCDLDVLATLPRTDLVAGLAEVVKCGFIADPVILDLVEARPATRRRGRDGAAPARAHRAGRPGQGRGRRRGPARELAARDPQLRPHASATPSSRSSTTRGGTARRSASAWSTSPSSPGSPGGWTTRWWRVTERAQPLGLPTTYRGDRWPQLLDAMRRDKKSRGSLLRFVVLDGLARPNRLEGLTPHCCRPPTRRSPATEGGPRMSADRM